MDPKHVNCPVAQKIGTAIVTWRYPPGTVLDGEIAASRELEISRAAYREALRRVRRRAAFENKEGDRDREVAQDDDGV